MGVGGGMGEAHGKAQTNAWLTHNPDEVFYMNLVGRHKDTPIECSFAHFVCKMERHYQAMC